MKRKSLVFLTVAAAALVFVSAAWALRFTDESYVTPIGTVGSPYSFTFSGAGGCGPALPYQFSLIGGSLPPGLTLAKSGTASGARKSASWGTRGLGPAEFQVRPPATLDVCRQRKKSSRR